MSRPFAVWPEAWLSSRDIHKMFIIIVVVFLIFSFEISVGLSQELSLPAQLPRQKSERQYILWRMISSFTKIGEIFRNFINFKNNLEILSSF